MNRLTRDEAESLEATLISELKDLQREYLNKAEPLTRRLVELHALKSPPPVSLPDGRTFVYTGPSHYVEVGERPVATIHSGRKP